MLKLLLAVPSDFSCLVERPEPELEERSPNKLKMFKFVTPQIYLTAVEES